MPKLLMVTTVAVTIEAFLRPFARHFRALGWTVDAAARGVAGSEKLRQDFDRRYEMEWTRNPLDLSGLAKAAGKIDGLNEKNGYDIVHVHTPIAAFITRFALRRARAAGKVKIVYTAHGFHFYKGAPACKNLIFKTAERRAAVWTDHLIVINGEDYEAALRMLPPEKVTYTEGGIGMDVKKYRGAVFSAEEISVARREMGAGPDDTLILMIAEFSRGKRHRDLISALAETNDPEIRLAFAGTGLLFEETQKLAVEKGVAGQIKFLGFRDDIPRLIAASDTTALPSEREGLPRSIMESMASGKPVIGADIRGIRDMLSGGCGTLVPSGDVKGLAAAMKKHVAGGPEMANIREKSRKKAEIYDVETIIAELGRIYAELLR